MQFAFTEEQLLIRDTARGFFDEHGVSARVRAAIARPDGHDPALWNELVEMGWTGIAVPEALGGSGLGWVELCLLQAEQGRRLVPSPFFATACLAAPLLQQVAAPAQQAAWLPSLVDGSLRFGCALTGTRGLPGAEGGTVALRRGPGCSSPGWSWARKISSARRRLRPRASRPRCSWRGLRLPQSASEVPPTRSR